MSSTDKKRSALKILRTGDPRSAFHTCSPEKILKMYGVPRRLLSSSTKAEKSAKLGVLNKVMYLTPGVFCVLATFGCLANCLGHTSGRMVLPTSTRARDRRTALYKEDPEHFLRLLRADLCELREEALCLGMMPAVRLNGTSDIPWEELHSEIFEEFSDIKFFDYTKIGSRMWRFLKGQCGNRPWPTNYHLTFSISENNQAEALQLLCSGANVAVVFWPALPDMWLDLPVIDGDAHDARFLDPSGVIVGLSAKGIAKEDLTGFVVHTDKKQKLMNAA